MIAGHNRLVIPSMVDWGAVRDDDEDTPPRNAQSCNQVMTLSWVNPPNINWSTVSWCPVLAKYDCCGVSPHWTNCRAISAVEVNGTVVSSMPWRSKILDGIWGWMHVDTKPPKECCCRDDCWHSSNTFANARAGEFSCNCSRENPPAAFKGDNSSTPREAS